MCVLDAAAITIGVSVPPRHNPTAPKFGQWLHMQRGKRSLEQVAISIRPLVAAAGLKVDQSLIYRIEQGRIPNWPILAAFSRVYNIPFPALAAQLADAVEFPGAVTRSGIAGAENASLNVRSHSQHAEGPSNEDASTRVVNSHTAADSEEQRELLEVQQLARLARDLSDLSERMLARTFGTSPGAATGNAGHDAPPTRVHGRKRRAHR